MSDNVFRRHIARLRISLLRTAQYETYGDWMTQNTFLKGDPFSFVDHEYQETLAQDTSQDICVVKCSQIGISEFSIRRALAILQLHTGTTVLYTLPTATFASTFVKTRIDPVLESSPMLRDSIHPGVDSAMVKRFTNDSFFYARGASGTGQAISIPVDFLIFDEVDFSDQTILDTFTSRLTHSTHKGRFRLSTPTIPGYGISDDFKHCIQHFEMIKCDHCGQWFLPDYYEHVVLPGFKGDSLKEVTKQNIAGLDLSLAYVECPNCSLAPNFAVENRNWVIKNPDAGYDRVGYTISPFSAPKIISPGYLIETSTQYDRTADFVNFSLGKAMEDAETTLSKEEVKACFIRGEPPRGMTTVMGLDMGGLCCCHIGVIEPNGNLVIIHSEQIPLAKVETRRQELKAQYRVIMEVVDGLPYTDIVMRFQQRDPNCWASLFVRLKTMGVWQVKLQEADEEKAMASLRQLNVNRNKGLDTMMEWIRSGHITFFDSEQTEIIVDHITDMKRIKQYTTDNELEFVWVKSKKGVDHYFFALLYLYLASKLRGMASAAVQLPFVMSKIKMDKTSKRPTHPGIANQSSVLMSRLPGL